MFKDLPRPLKLSLEESTKFPDGTVISVYKPIGRPA